MDPQDNARVPLVRRALPTDPAVRSSESLFLTEAADGEGRPSRRLLFSGPAPAPDEVARRMGVVPGADLLTRRRLMLMDGVPIRLAVSYFLPDAPEAGALAGGDFLKDGLQALFERHNRVFGRSEETLDARLPDPAESELLALQAGQPVVEILRSSYDTHGCAVHTLQTICAAGRHQFVIRQFPGDRAF